jgi:predicted nucleic acid-binding protein
MKLIDTSAIVDIDRGGVEDRVAKLDDEGRHAISTATVTELRLGVNKQYDSGTETHSEAVTDLNRLLSRFDLLEIHRAVAIAAADIIDTLQRQGEPLHDLHDVYIAATARTEQLPVLTANVAHFERIDDIDVVDWTTY